MNHFIFLNKGCGRPRKTEFIISTQFNIEKLMHGLLWIIGGTFKTTPTIFGKIHPQDDL